MANSKKPMNHADFKAKRKAQNTKTNWISFGIAFIILVTVGLAFYLNM